MNEMLNDWPIGTLLFVLVLVASGLVLFMLAALGYEIVDRSRGEVVWVAGKVEQKDFTPKSTRTGVGVGPAGGSNGGMTTVVTSSHENAKWVLLADIRGWEEFVPVEVTPRDFKRAKIGGGIRLEYTKGRSGQMYGPNGYELE